MVRVVGGRLVEADRTLIAAPCLPLANDQAVATQKRRDYTRFPTLEEFVAIEQVLPFVTVWRRGPSGHLLALEVADGLDQSARLESLGLTLSLAELHRNVTFPAFDDRSVA